MKLKKLKLTQLNNVELREDEMKHLIGAESCGCGCNGSSSAQSNATFNWNAGYSQSSGGNNYCASWGDQAWETRF